ncbi:unnamed protein product [Ectocarpus fasciculatus]
MVDKGHVAAEGGTVVVGTAPPLEDVLSRAYTERPFDLDSFLTYAKKNYFSENLAFLEEVTNLRGQREKEKYRLHLLHIMTEYVRANSPSEVNLSHNERKEAEMRVATVLDQVFGDPLTEPSDRGCLDGAYNAILAMVKADNYARYKDFIVAQRQLRVARLEAIWWMQDGLTMKTFFSFPSPVNNAESRLHACFTTLYMPLATYLAWRGVPWMWVCVTYGYTARVLCGPRLDPQAFFVLFVLRPFVVDRLGLLHDEFTSGAPKRFAQSIGLVFSATCMVLAFFKQYHAMEAVAACLFGASFLAGFCDFCIACVIFGMAARAKIVPATVCEDCNLRYILGSQQEGSAYMSKSPKSQRTSK